MGIDKDEDLKVEVGESKQVMIAHGDSAMEWEVRVGEETYRRQLHYDINWYRKGRDAGDGKYPSPEVQDLLEVIFRQHQSVVKDQ